MAATVYQQPLSLPAALVARLRSAGVKTAGHLVGVFGDWVKEELDLKTEVVKVIGVNEGTSSTSTSGCGHLQST